MPISTGTGPAKPQRVLISYSYLSQGIVGEVILDASISETHSSSADITKHPVENGFSITDHIRPLPPKLSITALVSNTPLSSPDANTTFSVGQSSATYTTNNGQQFAVKVSTFSNRFERPITIADALRSALESGEALFTVTTTLKQYENLGCTSFSAPRNAALGDALQFTMEFEQLRFVDAQNVEALPSKSPGVAPAKKGHQPTKEASEQEQTNTDTYALKLGHAVAKSLGFAQ